VEGRQGPSFARPGPVEPYRPLTIVFDWHVHEAANARLVEELGCGLASRRTDAVANELARLVGDPEHRRRLRERAASVAQGAPGRAFARDFFSRLTGRFEGAEPPAAAAE